MWRGAYVGCFLRSELYDASVTLHCSRAFQHMAFFREQEDEEELLQQVEILYQCGEAQRAQQRLHWDKGQGTEPHHMDVVCTSLLDHFKKRRRWQKVRTLCPPESRTECMSCRCRMSRPFDSLQHWKTVFLRVLCTRQRCIGNWTIQ